MAQQLLGHRSWLPKSPLVVLSLALNNLLREKEAYGMAVTHNLPAGRFWQSHHPHKVAKTGSMPVAGTT